jgi:hypothetical protein
MITPKDGTVSRVTMTLDPVDIDLLDRLARLEGLNRSEEMRSILRQVRPMMKATVEAFEAALAQRDLFDQAAADAAVVGLEQLLPEVEELSRRYAGAMSRLEGAAAASEASDPRPSNHGGHTPTPTPDPTPLEDEE